MSETNDLVNNDEDNYFSDDNEDVNNNDEDNYFSDDEKEENDEDNYFSDDEKNENEEDNYFSDDENDEDNEEKELTFDELYPEEEIDDEMRQLLYKTAHNTIDYGKMAIEPVVKKKRKKKQKTKKKHIDIFDFTKDLSKKDDKPKKWKSSRINRKKKKLNIVDKPRRSFRPRLPPPDKSTFYQKQKKEQPIVFLNKDSEFPALK